MTKGIKITLFALVIILCCGFLGWLTTGFTDFTGEGMGSKFDGKINEDNLYSSESCTLKDSNDGSGVIISVNDDGVITAKGKNNGATDLIYTIGNVSLEAGTYTFTAVNGGSLSTYYVEGIAGDDVVKADFTGNTFIVEENTIVTLRLVIKPGAEINRNVLPVIVSGAEAADFYA